MTFSVITVCFNAQDLLEKTILSVLEQTHPQIEYIIIDGKSRDNTLAIVEKYKGRIARIVSEPDQGIYDAMNKGIKLSSGDYLYFLNAGDQFVSPQTIAETAQFSGEQNAEIIYGNVQLQNKSDRWVLNDKAFTGEIKDLHYLYNNMFCQQRAFFKRSIFDQLGGFDVSYKIIADFELIFRAYQQGLPFAYLPKDIVSIPLGGVSNIHLDRFLKERLRTLLNLPWWQRYWALDLFTGALKRGSLSKYFKTKIKKIDA